MLDKADRMLDMGFSNDIYDIIDRRIWQREKPTNLIRYGANGDVVEISMSLRMKRPTLLSNDSSPKIRIPVRTY